MLRIALLALFALTLDCGCAHAKPKTKAPVVVIVPPVVKVSQGELLHYKSSFLTFKALETEIMERYKINAEVGDSFNPDTGEITRGKPKPTTPQPPTARGDK